MGFVFVKLTSGEIISSNGGLAFRILSTTDLPIPPEPPQPEQKGFDLTKLGLPSGRYTITVTANAKNHIESEKSKSVIYIVE